MTAIGAIFDVQSGAPLARPIARMCEALGIYGNDRSDCAVDGPMALAWTQTIGFTPQDAAEAQPMTLGERRWMVFDGRLDHRDDLCRALGLAPEAGRNMADGMLVLLAWRRWDKRAVEHLYGAYSLIVADAARQRVVALRSPLAAPPLFHARTRDQVVIASMPCGIFALGGIQREIDDQRIADCLVGNFEDRTASYFKGISNLPLGHMLLADRDRTVITRFYDLRDTAPVRFKRNADYVEAADALLQAAVASAMRSIETPALALSSGLDSPSIAVAALAHLAAANAPAKPLLGICHVPASGWDGRVPGAGNVGDESPPVRALAARYPALDVRFIDSAGIAIDAGLDRYIALADMPMRELGNLYWNRDLAQHVCADGRRVLLSGASGNWTISMGAANAVLSALFRSGRWNRLIQAVRARNGRDNPRVFGLSGLFGNAVLPHLPDFAYAAYQRLRYAGQGQGWRSWSAIHPDFAEAMQVDARIRELGWNDLHRPLYSRNEQLAVALDRGNRHQGGVLTTAWEAFTGVQMRDPLGDRRLVEFCYAIPDDQFFRDGVDRQLVRRMMADRLPSEILQAPRGRQSADWPMRLRRDANRFISEVDAMATNSVIASRIDLPRLRAGLSALSAGGQVQSVDRLAQFGIAFGDALVVGRFLAAGCGAEVTTPRPARET